MTGVPPPGSPPRLSVIVPVRDEEESLELLYREIVAALRGRFPDYEILFIDDGSRDGSLAVMNRLQARDGRVTVIHFGRNRGQSAALAAGFARCRFEVAVTIDGDLQNDPADIPLLVERLQAGVDLVCGWRRERRDRFLTRRLPSLLGNRLIQGLARFPVHDSGCTLRAYTAPTARMFSRLRGEMHRYIPLLAARAGARLLEIPVNHRARRAGCSKYGLGRVFRVPADLIFVLFPRVCSRPGLHVLTFLGVLLLLAGAWLSFRPPRPGGGPWLSVAVVMLLAGSGALALRIVAARFGWELPARVADGDESPAPPGAPG